MIALALDCLVFELANGERIPFSVEMISVELLGNAARQFDLEFVRHAAKAVFHYFKVELGRQAVTAGEFAGALEKVLCGFKQPAPASVPRAVAGGELESDLRRLAREADDGELFFFPRLRDELRQHLQQGPRVLRFRGLRGCVKQLVGARRWTPRCRNLEEHIVQFLRECLSLEARAGECAMVVE